MGTPEPNAEVLLNLGFVDVGRWEASGTFIAYGFDGEDGDANHVLFDASNALYAFVCGDRVLYIGKTARSIRKRFVGYCRPGKRQATNLRCHYNIKTAIAEGLEIRIFAFVPITHLQYADFEINLAAGLEDSLIREFDPPWNGRERGQPISEEAEREGTEETERQGASTANDVLSKPAASGTASASFSIVLGSTHYSKGFLNLGVEASRSLGKDGDPVRIVFSDGSPTVITTINRTANRTGAVRLVGGSRRIAEWLHEHFREGDTLECRVIDPHTIELLASRPSPIGSIGR